MRVYNVGVNVSVKTSRTVLFVCEKCGEEHAYKQDWERRFSRDLRYYSEPSQEDIEQVKKKLYEKAAIEKEKTEARKSKLTDYGNEACPHCGYLQSWQLGSYRNRRMSKFSTVPILITAVLIFILWTLLDAERCLLGIGIWLAGLFVIALITTQLALVTDPQKKVERVETINAPTIEWDEIVVE